MTKEKREKYIRIIITLILILLLVFLIISHIIGKIGKIGYISTSAEPTDIIYVTENDVDWDLLEELNIFNNIKYNNKKIIAPGSTGSYSFYVTNTTDESLVYDVQLREINEYGVNMQYKLKLENVYVAGDKQTWKSIEEVNLENVIIAPNSTNRYTLEWCWAHDDGQDTKIGELSYADYTLRIKIGAQIYNKDVGDNR